MALESTARRSRDTEIDDAAVAWIARRDVGLTPAEETRLATWLAAKPEHRAAFSAWEKTWTRLDRPFELGQASRLQAEVESRVCARKRRRTRKIVASFASVAFVASVAFLLTSFGVWRGFAPDAAMPPAAPASTTLMLPERKTLPDGTLVEMTEGARFSVEYSAAARRIVLHAGEAHFEVVPDSARPFFVNAGGVDVRAVGTAFSVQLEPGAVAVLVTHGRVAVSRENASRRETISREPAADRVAQSANASAAQPADATPLATLGAGERVVVARSPQPMPARAEAVSVAEQERLLAWRVRRVEFSGASLAEAVALLNRHAADGGGPRFTIADRGLETVRLSGLFRLAQTEAFVQLLERGFGVTAERSGDREILLRRAPQTREETDRRDPR